MGREKMFVWKIFEEERREECVGSVGDDGIGKREHVEDAFLQRQVNERLCFCPSDFIEERKNEETI